MAATTRVLCLCSLTALLLLAACENGEDDATEAARMFVGATVWTGADELPIENAVIEVADGRILDVYSRDDREPLAGVETIDLSGSYVVPGLINAHGHVGMADGLQSGPEVHSEELVREQLRRYAHYGITTVVSLGDEPREAFEVRDAQDATDPQMARVFLAGSVVNAETEEEAREQVAERAERDPDWVKIRVDDGLGQREKMPESVYAEVIAAAHDHDLPLAAHMVYLEDAKGLLRHNADLLAHSVRDEPVDDELIDLMLAQGVCITPTLTREISTFIYAERPDFFDDPFFLEHAPPDAIEALEDPEVQERYTGRAAEYFEQALPIAIDNMMRLHEAGVGIALGTDSGPPARFQGYFEHEEMAMMQEAGMTPEEVLASATRVAAECMELVDLGTLEPGNWADFVVLAADPLDDVEHLREIRDVYIAGERFE